MSKTKSQDTEQNEFGWVGSRLGGKKRKKQFNYVHNPNKWSRSRSERKSKGGSGIQKSLRQRILRQSVLEQDGELLGSISLEVVGAGALEDRMLLLRHMAGGITS